MANVKAAIEQAKAYGLNAYVSNNQVVVKKRAGTQVVGRINADGTVAYTASGYSSEVTGIAAKVTAAASPAAAAPAVQNLAGFSGTSARTMRNIEKYGYDAIEME